jgi:hypothetical protein
VHRITPVVSPLHREAMIYVSMSRLMLRRLTQAVA